MPSRLTGAILVVVIVGGATIPAARNNAQLSSLQVSSSRQAGMRAYIDPLTGKLIPGPAPEAQRELALPQLVPDNSKLELLEMEDGTKGVLFHGQRQATVVARVQADGSIKTECIESTAALPTATPEAHHD